MILLQTLKRSFLPFKPFIHIIHSDCLPDIRQFILQVINRRFDRSWQKLMSLLETMMIIHDKWPSNRLHSCHFTYYIYQLSNLYMKLVSEIVLRIKLYKLPSELFHSSVYIGHFNYWLFQHTTLQYILCITFYTWYRSNRLRIQNMK